MNLYIFVVLTGHDPINTGINSHLCQNRIDRAQRAHLWPVWVGIIAGVHDCDGVAQTCCNASTAAWSTSLTRSRSRVLCTHTQLLRNHARLVFTYRTHDMWCAHGRPSCPAPYVDHTAVSATRWACRRLCLGCRTTPTCGGTSAIRLGTGSCTINRPLITMHD